MLAAISGAEQYWAVLSSVSVYPVHWQSEYGIYVELKGSFGGLVLAILSIVTATSV